MPQYPLDFRQLCPTFQHPPGQTVAKHMRGDIFQPPRQVYERLAACDVSLTLYLSAQVLCGASPKLSHRSLRHPLRDSYPGGLPFRRHRNSDQKQFSLLVTTKSRQSLWAAHTLKVAAQQTRSIKMQRNTTRFACEEKPMGNVMQQWKVFSLPLLGFVLAALANIVCGMVATLI